MLVRLKGQEHKVRSVCLGEGVVKGERRGDRIKTSKILLETKSTIPFPLRKSSVYPLMHMVQKKGLRIENNGQVF